MPSPKKSTAPPAKTRRRSFHHGSESYRSFQALTATSRRSRDTQEVEFAATGRHKRKTSRPETSSSQRGGPKYNSVANVQATHRGQCGDEGTIHRVHRHRSETTSTARSMITLFGTAGGAERSSLTPKWSCHRAAIGTEPAGENPQSEPSTMSLESYEVSRH